MRYYAFGETRLVSWFVAQRVFELVMLGAIVGCFYVYHTHIGPFVPHGLRPWFSADLVQAYVLSSAEALFGFVIVVQVGYILWITSRPPRRSAVPIWWA